MQARWGTHGDHPVIILTPSSVKEIYELTIKAFNYSEKYRVPVILLMDEVIAHMREKIELFEEGQVEVINRKTPASREGFTAYKADDDLVPLMAPFGEGYKFHVTGLTHTEVGYPTGNPEVSQKLVSRLINKVELHAEDIALYDETDAEDAEILIVTFGCTARSAMQAVKQCREQGLKAGLFKPKTLYPFPEKRYLELIKNKKCVIVPELNLGQLRLEVERITKGMVKVTGLNKVSGEMLTPDEIAAKIKEEL
jgi:2-oxoglutarate ferredoxin oxidoreductase subunit alpha